MVLMELCIYPLGKGESVSPYVARCLEVVQASGLDYRCRAMATEVEGELHEVLDLVRRCFATLESDCDRIQCSIRLDYRKGRKGQLDAKVASVEKRLGHAVRK